MADCWSLLEQCALDWQAQNGPQIKDEVFVENTLRTVKQVHPLLFGAGGTGNILPVQGKMDIKKYLGDNSKSWNWKTTGSACKLL